jgi:hypothetical protein
MDGVLRMKAKDKEGTRIRIERNSLTILPRRGTLARELFEGTCADDDDRIDRGGLGLFFQQRLRSTVGVVYCPLQDQKSIEDHLGIDIWNFPRVLATSCRDMSMASFLFPRRQREYFISLAR